MGILDDAIREHLDLKRRQGADQDELARLEDEAFGPPSRPGDPDFAKGEGASGPEGAGALDESAGATATEVPAFLDQEADEPSEADETAMDLEPEASEDGPSATEEATAIPGEPTVEHDTLGSGEEPAPVELDIDLDIDDEIEDVSDLDLDEDEADEAADSGSEASGGEAASATDEPIESLDTVEHHFEGAIDEAEVVEDDSEELSIDDSDDEDEDVLEETPEFLRDAPEDDELWFEQGEPKDFDF